MQTGDGPWNAEVLTAPLVNKRIKMEPYN